MTELKEQVTWPRDACNGSWDSFWAEGENIFLCMKAVCILFGGVVESSDVVWRFLNVRGHRVA